MLHSGSDATFQAFLDNFFLPHRLSVQLFHKNCHLRHFAAFRNYRGQSFCDKTVIEYRNTQNLEWLDWIVAKCVPWRPFLKRRELWHSCSNPATICPGAKWDKSAIKYSDITLTQIGNILVNFQECPICFEKLCNVSHYTEEDDEGGDCVFRLDRCNHYFHKSCLYAMYNSGPKVCTHYITVLTRYLRYTPGCYISFYHHLPIQARTVEILKNTCPNYISLFPKRIKKKNNNNNVTYLYSAKCQWPLSASKK